MKSFPNVVIVSARCSRTRHLFGVRCEEESRQQWIIDWAFALDETQARREGYDKSTAITGQFALDTSYPNCPYCETAQSLFKCGCGKIACWDSESRFVSCPWCGEGGELGGAVSSMAAGHDR